MSLLEPETKLRVARSRLETTCLETSTSDEHPTNAFGQMKDDLLQMGLGRDSIKCKKIQKLNIISVHNKLLNQQ